MHIWQIQAKPNPLIFLIKVCQNKVEVIEHYKDYCSWPGQYFTTREELLTTIILYDGMKETTLTLVHWHP